MTSNTGERQKILRRLELIDGIWMIVANISNTTEPEEYRLRPEELIYFCLSGREFESKKRLKKLNHFLSFNRPFLRCGACSCSLHDMSPVLFAGYDHHKQAQGKTDEKTVGSARKVYKTLSRCELGKVSVNGTNVAD